LVCHPENKFLSEKISLINKRKKERNYISIPGIPPPLPFTDRRLRGMCHKCFSSNVLIILNEEDGTTVCNDYLEKKEYSV